MNKPDKPITVIQTVDPAVQHNDARFLELLQRWQNGDFTRADEQELNALAASDDFRREALEGFMAQPEVAHDQNLASLRQRLNYRAGGGKRQTMPQWWALAAALVLVLGAVWFWSAPDRSTGAPVAQSESAPESATTVGDSVLAAPAGDYAANTASRSQKSPSAASGPAATGSGVQTIQTPDAVVALEESESGAGIQDDAGAVAAQPASAPPGAAPQQGDFGADKMKETQPLPTADVAVSKPAPEAAKAKKSTVPGRNADSTWHSTDRKPDMAAEKKAARDEATPKESEPEGGWEAFNDYLRQNARLPSEARNRNISGMVRLQFNLNNNGEPQGFIFLRSLGYGCDQEAIRLVQNWEWKRGQNPIITVEIPFVR